MFLADWIKKLSSKKTNSTLLGLVLYPDTLEWLLLDSKKQAYIASSHIDKEVIKQTNFLNYQNNIIYEVLLVSLF